MISKIKRFMRAQEAVSKTELQALLVVGNTAAEQRAFALAFGEARRALEEEHVFFRAPHKGCELYTRCVGDGGAVTISNQLSRRTKVARNALRRALDRARLAIEADLTKDVRRLEALRSASDRLQMQEAHIELFVGKRKCTP